MNGEDALSLAASRAVAFRDRLPLRPQRPLQDFAASRAQFAGPLPEEGLEASACIDDLADRAEPGLHAKVGDRFFGWVIGGSHPVGVAADWLTSAWGQNAGNHQADGALFAGGAAWHGRQVMRLSVISWLIDEAAGMAAAEAIVAAWRAVRETA